MGELSSMLRRQLGEARSGAAALGTPDRRRQRRLAGCVNVADVRALARRTVPRAVFDFVDGGAGDEITLRRNEDDFSNYVLAPRALNGCATIACGTTVLGRDVALPVLGSPTGLAGLAHHHGELGIARALHAAGSAYVLSCMGSYSIEEIAAGSPGPTWLQLYVWRDRGLVRELIERARAAGFEALVLTIDVPRSGLRERDVRNGFGVPPRLTGRTLADSVRRPRWAIDLLRHHRAELAGLGDHVDRGQGSMSMTEYTQAQFDPGIGWGDLAWIQEQWNGPVVLKGVLRAEDAAQAVRLGVEAIGVSNHGGRQLDRVASSISALPAIADAVGGEAEILVDGGIRRGADVIVALALGATACLVGRPFVHGLAAGGEPGAARVAAILRDEIELCLTLLGAGSVRDLDRSWLAAPEPVKDPN